MKILKYIISAVAGAVIVLIVSYLFPEPSQVKHRVKYHFEVGELNKKMILANSELIAIQKKECESVKRSVFINQVKAQTNDSLILNEIMKTNTAIARIEGAIFRLNNNLSLSISKKKDTILPANNIVSGD